MKTTPVLDRFLIATTGIVALYSINNISEASIIPSKNWDIPLDSGSRYSWEHYKDNPYYTIVSEVRDTFKQIEIIHSVVAQLINNSESLEPEIVKVVDENFWDLF